MPKRQPNKIYPVVETIDRAAADAIFAIYKMPNENSQMAFERLLALIAYIRILEADIGADPAIGRHISLAKKQRDVFTKLSKALDGVAEKMGELEKRRQRARNDPKYSFYIPGVGEEQFSCSVGPELIKILAPDFLLNFDIDIPPSPKDEERERDQIRGAYRSARSSASGWNIYYSNEEIKKAAPTIASEILRRIALGLRRAERMLFEDTVGGGARPDPIRETVLLNIIALWRDAISHRGIYFNLKRGPFTRFVRDICGLLGVRNFCTETHVENAIDQFKKRLGR